MTRKVFLRHGQTLVLRLGKKNYELDFQTVALLVLAETIERRRPLKPRKPKLNLGVENE